MRPDASRVALYIGGMSRYLLLHGSWHGAWCWHKVAPLLRRDAEVRVPNLPGRGRDAALAHFVTLGRMVDVVSRELDAEEPTTIVVHSRYGVVASAVAERFPSRVRRVIYLASFMLGDGERVLPYFQHDEGSHIRPFVKVSRAGLWDALDPAAWVEGLYADCSAEDVELASALLCREPSLPALARLALTAERYGTVPRAYIRLSQDRAVSPALQDRLIAQSPPHRVETLAASHSAYFSRPEELAATIRRLDAS